MMAVPLTELGNIRKCTVQFGTLESECLRGLQVGHWVYRSGTQKKLVGDTMQTKYVIEPMGVDK